MNRMITMASLLIAVAGGNLQAQNPGGLCTPGTDAGFAARVVVTEGSVRIFDNAGRQVPGGDGAFIPAGSAIETGSNGRTEIAFEDGTADRPSRIRIQPDTRLVVKGGLFCSDLRPIRDEGRWSVREINLELSAGAIEIDLAAKVKYDFNLEVRTPNAVARMVRGSETSMRVEMAATGLEGRTLVPVIEHPRIRNQITLNYLGERSIDDLSESERHGIMAHAASMAFSLGLVDLKTMGLLENPQMQSTIETMTRGRVFEDLEPAERETVSHGIVMMAIGQGALDPNSLNVYSEPDERTYMAVRAGKMRIHNTQRGWSSKEAVDVEAGSYTEVRGYEPPIGATGLSD